MRPVETMAGLMLTDAMVCGRPCDSANDFAAPAPMVEQALLELVEAIPAAAPS